MTPREKALTIKDDTLTLLLANAIHREEDREKRALKIKKTAKLIQKRTKDKKLKQACHKIRDEKCNSLIIKALETAEYRYFLEYHSL